MYFKQSLLPLLLASATAVHGYKLTFYAEQCTSPGGEHMDPISVTPADGCRSDYAGTARSVVVRATPADYKHTVVFYTGDDCDEANTSRVALDGCIPFDIMGSFRVVEEDLLN